mgnify:CR=1 FL=1
MRKVSAYYEYINKEGGVDEKMVVAEWDFYVELDSFFIGTFNKYKGKLDDKVILNHIQEFVDSYKKDKKVK